MSVTIRVTSNRFPAIAGRFPVAVADLQQKAVLDTLAAADPPVDTGALKNNTSTTKDSVAWHQGYAAYVHDGTRYMAPRPFARMAVDRVAPGYFAALGNLEGALG